LEAGIVLKPSLQSSQQFDTGPAENQGSSQPHQEGTNPDRKRNQGEGDHEGDHKGTDNGADGEGTGA